MDKTSGGSVTRTVSYYPLGGTMRINISGGSNTLYYLLKDQLGSASVVTDASGTNVGEDRFYPYGETRFTTGSMNTDKLYTGQREITGLGIYHYGARFYSPKLGRFLSPDTIVPGAVNPQALNRYSYVLGNPLKYIDPSGHGACQTEEDCEDMGTTPMGDSEGPDWDSLSGSGYDDWEIEILEELYNNGGSDGIHAVWYIINNNIHITVGEEFRCTGSRYHVTAVCTGDWQSVGSVSGWYEGDDFIVLNPQYNTYGEMPGDWALSIVVHEALHIEQGYLKAFTKDGELEGYQVGIRVYLALSGKGFEELDYPVRDLYLSTSGWDYGQKMKKYQNTFPGYWQGLRLLPPWWSP